MTEFNETLKLFSFYDRMHEVTVIYTCRFLIFATNWHMQMPYTKKYSWQTRTMKVLAVSKYRQTAHE